MKRLLAGDDELRCCDACGYPAPVYSCPGVDIVGYIPADPHLCTLCSETLGLSSVFEGRLLAHQNFCANAILDQLGAFDQEPQP